MFIAPTCTHEQMITSSGLANLTLSKELTRRCHIHNK
uniref:Uncharacterized protein n=1 Tax=Arundo donax TaxID=35708 RepID=A0A0A9API8_ARUDO